MSQSNENPSIHIPKFLKKPKTLKINLIKKNNGFYFRNGSVNYDGKIFFVEQYQQQLTKKNF